MKLKGETIMTTGRKLGRMTCSSFLFVSMAAAGEGAGFAHAVSSPLVAIEQHRGSVVQRIVAEWSDALAALPPERRLTARELSDALWTLRSDRLLAASLAGTHATIETLLADDRQERHGVRSLGVKNLGDASADLVYTPVNPCRIADTRAAGGALVANASRTFDGYAASSFAAQGGTASDCAMPNGVAAIAMNVYAVNPAGLGFIKLWPANSAEPAVSTVNYQAGITAIATGAIVPVDGANSNRFVAKSPLPVHFIADVVGYFRAPAGVIGDISGVSAGAGLTGGSTSGNAALGIATGGVTAAMLASNGCGAGQLLKYNGSAWVCAADNAGPANAFVHGGNAFGASAVLGTTDNNALELRVNGGRALRIEPNAASPNIVAGHVANAINVGGTFTGQTIAGGGRPGSDCAEPGGAATRSCANQTLADSATIGGGYSNQAYAFAVVGGGKSNNAHGNTSVVSGGLANGALNAYSTIGGGSGNTASGISSTVGGGQANAASGTGSAIGGGSGNTAPNSHASVAGGSGNSATADYAAIGGGTANAAQGFASTVPGGINNSALAAYSFAAGRRAKATTTGSFIWADSRNFDFQPSVTNFFGVRATGGVGLTVAIDPSTGAVSQYCNLLPGVPSWQCTSDRNAKENFVAVDGKDILKRLAAMPLSTWNFKGADPAVRSLGPTAQDFHAAFGLGNTDRAIASGNIEGVALAAIQGLNAEVNEQAEKIAAQRREIAELRRGIEVLMARTAPEGRVARAR
jgi:endosialidase-like protein